MAKKKAAEPAAAAKPAAETRKTTARKASARKATPATEAAETRKPARTTRKSAQPAEAKKTTEAKKPARTRKSEPAPAPAETKASRTRTTRTRTKKAEPVAVETADAPQETPKKKTRTARKKSADTEAAADAEAALRRVHELAEQVRALVGSAVESVDRQARAFEERLEEHLAAVRRRSAEVQLELGATLNQLEAVRCRQQTVDADAQQTWDALATLQQQCRGVGEDVLAVGRQVEGLRRQLTLARTEVEATYRTEPETEVVQATLTTEAV